MYSDSRYAARVLAGRCSAGWLWSFCSCATAVTRVFERIGRKSTRNTGERNRTCTASRCSPRKRTPPWVFPFTFHFEKKESNWIVGCEKGSKRDLGKYRWPRDKINPSKIYFTAFARETCINFKLNPSRYYFSKNTFRHYNQQGLGFLS